MLKCGCKKGGHSRGCQKCSSDARKAIVRENRKLDSRKGTLR